MNSKPSGSQWQPLCCITQEPTVSERRIQHWTCLLLKLSSSHFKICQRSVPQCSAAHAKVQATLGIDVRQVSETRIFIYPAGRWSRGLKNPLNNSSTSWSSSCPGTTVIEFTWCSERTHDFLDKNPWGVNSTGWSQFSHFELLFNRIAPLDMRGSRPLKYHSWAGCTSISTIASCLGVNRWSWHVFTHHDLSKPIYRNQPGFLWTKEDRTNSAAGHINLVRCPMGTAWKLVMWEHSRKTSRSPQWLPGNIQKYPEMGFRAPKWLLAGWVPHLMELPRGPEIWRPNHPSQVFMDWPDRIMKRFLVEHGRTSSPPCIYWIYWLEALINVQKLMAFRACVCTLRIEFVAMNQFWQELWGKSGNDPHFLEQFRGGF